MKTDVDLGYIFSDSLIEVISTFSGFFVSVLSEDRDDSFDGITCVMAMHGNKNGTLFFSLAEADVRILCSSILGIQQDEVTTGDIEDAMCELLNMIAGSARLRLSETDYMFNLVTPFIFKGENIMLFTKNKTSIISQIIGNSTISMKLKVIY